MEISEEILIPVVAVTWILDKKISILIASLILLSSLAVAGQSFVFPGEESNSYNYDNEEWFRAPTYDSQQELLFQILAPFAFLVILLQIAFQKALRMTFAEDDENPWLRGDKPDVFRESVLMAVTVSAILLASPYWSLMRKMAASIGILSVGMLILLFLFMAYLFITGG